MKTLMKPKAKQQAAKAPVAPTKVVDDQASENDNSYDDVQRHPYNNNVDTENNLMAGDQDNDSEMDYPITNQQQLQRTASKQKSSEAIAESSNQSKTGWLGLAKDKMNDTSLQTKKSTRKAADEEVEEAYEYAQPINQNERSDQQPVEYQGTKQQKTKVLKEFLEKDERQQKQNNQLQVKRIAASFLDGNENQDTDDGTLFGNFRFKSFRTHKLIEEDYTLLKVDDVEELPQINTTRIFPEHHLSKNSIELVAIDQKSLALKEKELASREKEKDRQAMALMREEHGFIDKKHGETTSTLYQRRKELEKIIEKKQQRSKEEFMVKKQVLSEKLKGSVINIIRQIKRQRDIITQSYGPLILADKKEEPALFSINKELDPEGAKWVSDLNKAQSQIPQTLLVKVRTVRCMKDKVASGHYLVIVHALDRIGGSRINFELTKTESYYKIISKNLRDFAKKKRAFLNENNRLAEQNKKDGTAVFQRAQATGANFFKAQMQNDLQALEDQGDMEMQRPGDGDEEFDYLSASSSDFNQYFLIDFERTYTRYQRFNGRYSDENLAIDDTVSVLIPPFPQTTNVLLFQLVLLESETVPKDYVVGWGVFPIVNSDFAVNEGKFKVPLLFGNINPGVDKFDKVEKAMMSDLDNWTANLYFEIEKVKLMDLKIEPKTDRLFYKPVVGFTAQEQQQMVKANSREDLDSLQHSAENFTKKNSKEKFDLLIKGRSTDEDDALTQSGFSNSSDELSSEEENYSGSDNDGEEDIDNQVAELVYNNARDDEDINYDNYQFSVSQKYDLTTRNLTYKKFKYIFDEIFIDLRWRQRKTIYFQTTIVMIIFLFFLRILIHYVGQYCILAIMGVPVTQYTPYWQRVEITYASWQFWQDCLFVATGAISNTIVFLFFVGVSWACTVWLQWFPKFWYKVICWIGIYAVLDPFLTFFFDTISQAWDSDMYKFYNYFVNKGDSGLVGIFITVFMITTETIFTGYVFYRFMVFTYMHGRILDLYRRLSGNYKAFFVPQDSEVSLKYLQWVIERARKKENVILSELRTMKDKFGYNRNVNFIQIFKIDKNVLKKSRLFFKDFDGSIIEVPQRKIIVATSDLKKIKRHSHEGGATIHGNPTFSMNEIIKSTYKTIKGHDEPTDALRDVHSYSGANNLATMKKLQMAEKQAASNSLYDSAQKGLLE